MENLAGSSFAPPQCMHRLLAQYCEAWQKFVPQISSLFAPIQSAITDCNRLVFRHVFVIVGIHLFPTVFLVFFNDISKSSRLLRPVKVIGSVKTLRLPNERQCSRSKRLCLISIQSSPLVHELYYCIDIF